MMDRNLVSRIENLEAAIAELRAEVERTRQSPSMRESGRCPSCNGGSLFRIFPIYEEANANARRPLSLVLTRGALGSFFQSAHEHRGALGVHVCRRCRVVEWYADNLDGVAPDGNVVTELEAPVEATPPVGPYR